MASRPLEELNLGDFNNLKVLTLRWTLAFEHNYFTGAQFSLLFKQINILSEFLYLDYPSNTAAIAVDKNLEDVDWTFGALSHC